MAELVEQDRALQTERVKGMATVLTGIWFLSIALPPAPWLIGIYFSAKECHAAVDAVAKGNALIGSGSKLECEYFHFSKEPTP